MKNNYWQNVRGLCILAVILIHCIYIPTISSQFITNIFIRKIIDFAVPIFVFMSAIFLKIDNLKTFYKKKIFRLIPALIIWDIIYVIIWCLTNDFSVIDIIKKIILSNSCPHLYYLYVLIQLFLIAPLIKKYLEKEKNSFLKHLPLLITPLYNLFLLLFWILTNKEFPLYQYFIFGWFSYFYLGLLIKEKNIKIIQINKFYWFTGLALIMSIIEGILVYKCANSYTLAVSQLGIFNSFFCMLLICILYKKSREEKVKESTITNIGNYSFGIYLSHILILKVVSKIINNLITSNYYTSIIITFTLTVIICYIINSIYYKKIKGVVLWKK